MGAGVRFAVAFASAMTAAAPVARPTVLAVPASNVIEAVSAQYAAVSNLVCTVRREASDGKGGKIETMSRVAWARGDRMNVHTLKPVERRTVIDGVTIQIKDASEKAPAIYQVTNQAPSQFANLRSVPGSPEEMLAPLVGLSASDVPPIHPFARTISLRDSAEDAVVARLSLDAEGRVARLDFDVSAARQSSSVHFRAPFEALPGVWLFRRTESEAVVDGHTIRMVSRFDKFEVNGDLPASLFDPGAFF